MMADFVIDASVVCTYAVKPKHVGTVLDASFQMRPPVLVLVSGIHANC